MTAYLRLGMTQMSQVSWVHQKLSNENKHFNAILKKDLCKKVHDNAA